MKPLLTGRSLGVPLTSGEEQRTAAELERLGFTSERANDVATAATKYATEETDKLVRQLTPRSSWSGVVVCRRHSSSQREETWLMLKHQGAGWHLDAALFV